MSARALFLGALAVVALCGISAASAGTDAETPAADEASASGQPSSSQLISEVFAAGGKIRVEEIRLIGNKVFDTRALEPITAQFVVRDLSAEDLEDLRVALTKRYVNAGYINSGAIIQDQSVVNGVLEVHIVEGRLTRIEISGDHHYRAGHLERMIAPDQGTTLNVNRMQERIHLLLQDGAVQRINAALVPGDEPGQSILKAAVQEGPRYRASIEVANDRPTSVGETGVSLDLGARNLLGVGDTVSANLGLTSGYRNYGLQGRLPVFRPDIAMFASLGVNHGSVVESTFRELDITSRESSAELGFSKELLRSLDSKLLLNSSLYYTKTETFLLGEPFSFTAGVDNGLSKVAAVRESLDWTHRETGQVMVVRGLIDVGFGGFGSTVHTDKDLPDSRFVVFKYQLEYARQMFSGVGQLVGRGEVQLTPQGLLPSEKIAVGGSDTVRGYRENFLVRDNGAVASLEYRHTVAHLQLQSLGSSETDGALALAAFADYGGARDHGVRNTTISSVGAGLRWTPSSNCLAQVYKGFPLQHDDSEGHSLQDKGIHFKLSYGVFF